VHGGQLAHAAREISGWDNVRLCLASSESIWCTYKHGSGIVVGIAVVLPKRETLIASNLVLC